jgi:endonuclease YncB( thermonuclease family)
MGSRHGAIAMACRHLGLAAAMSWSLTPAFAQISSPCASESVGTAKVSAVVDGRSFALDDGREVRLPGIEVPPPPRSGEAGLRADAGLAARAALVAMLAGQTVELRRSAPLADRYGRTLAHAWLASAGSPRSAAHEMLGQGFARVAAQVGNAACATELLAWEARARAAKLGLWGEAYYAVVGAESLPELLAERGHFTVVEGRVATVRESAGIIYINFGQRWSQALTVTVLKRNERTFIAAGREPRRLANLKLRVRGFIEERSGPRIEATSPEQIEIAER